MPAYNSIGDHLDALGIRLHTESGYEIGVVAVMERNDISGRTLYNRVIGNLGLNSAPPENALSYMIFEYSAKSVDEGVFVMEVECSTSITEPSKDLETVSVS